MKAYKIIIIVLAIVSMLFTLAWTPQPDIEPLPIPWPGAVAAYPRAGLISGSEADVDNLMTTQGNVADTPLAVVQAGHAFHLVSRYEAVFFGLTAGSAQFELEVEQMAVNGDRTFMGQDQIVLFDAGPERRAGLLHVPVVIEEPGLYRLAIISRTAAQSSAMPEPVTDEDEIVVWVLVTTQTQTPTPLPDEEAISSDDAPIQTDRALRIVATPTPNASETPEASPTDVPETAEPIDRLLNLALPRGHFAGSGSGAVENFDRNQNRTLVVPQGQSIMFKSAYEFVWFEGATGSAETRLKVRLEEARDDDILGQDSAALDHESARRQAGLLSAEVPFDEVGTFWVLATIDTSIHPGDATLDRVIEDQDTVRVQVKVVAVPEVGAISGQITAEEDGTPLEGVVIRVAKAATGHTVRLGYTAEDGRYLIPSLIPGDYYVYADPHGQNYLGEWYDDAPIRDQADAVTVIANTTLIDIDMALTQGGVIVGQVMEDGPQETPLQNVAVLAGTIDGQTIAGQTVTLADGSYRIEGLASADYWVYAGNPVQGLIGEFYDGHLLREDADPVNVTAGTVSEAIDFALGYGGSITGRVSVVNGTEASSTQIPVELKVTAYDFESDEVMSTVQVGPQGRYWIPSLPVGAYRIYAFDEDGRYRAEFYDDVTLPDLATPVEVQAGEITDGIDLMLEPSGVATVSIQPTSATLRPGEHITVAVAIEDVHDLAGFDLNLRYEPTVIQVHQVTVGELLSSTGREVIAVGPVIDPDQGLVTIGAVSVGDEPGPDGHGVLALVHLEALEIGKSQLALEQVQLADTAGAEIAARTVDGRISVDECIMGDLDCDCDVDIIDLMEVARRWNTVVGDPDYDPACDLDGDGDIDVMDLALVAAHWGDTCDDVSSAVAAQSVRKDEASLLATGMSLSPGTLNTPSSKPVIIEVLIDEAVDLGGFEFRLDYDADLLDLGSDDVALGDFLGSTGRAVRAVGPQINVTDGQGQVSFGAITLGATPPGADGAGVLARLTFHPKAAGETTLSLSRSQVTDTMGNSQENLATNQATLILTEGAASSFVPLIVR